MRILKQIGTVLMAALAIAPQAMASNKYEPGQVWQYQTRKGEEASTLTVIKIDQDKKSGDIISIYISGIKIENKANPSAPLTDIGHAPISRKALDESVIKLVDVRGEIPKSSLEGYTTWKLAFDQGKGGVFSISVAEIVDSIAAAVTNAKGA